MVERVLSRRTPRNWWSWPLTGPGELKMTLEIGYHDEQKSASAEWSYGTESGLSEVRYSVEHTAEGFAECTATEICGDAIPDEVLDLVLRECESRHKRQPAA